MDTDAYSRMIVENIESALIMESDADWDLRIKEIMQGAASAAKRLLDWPFDAQHARAFSHTATNGTSSGSATAAYGITKTTA